jgi:hypothetical protein
MTLRPLSRKRRAIAFGYLAAVAEAGLMVRRAMRSIVS